MLTRASASGPISEASTPVSARSSGPTTRRQRQAVSTIAPSRHPVGRADDRQLVGRPGHRDDALVVRTAVSEAGTAEPAGSRHTAYSSGSRSRSSMRADYGPDPYVPNGWQVRVNRHTSADAETGDQYRTAEKKVSEPATRSASSSGVEIASTVSGGLAGLAHPHQAAGQPLAAEREQRRDLLGSCSSSSPPPAVKSIRRSAVASSWPTASAGLPSPSSSLPRRDGQDRRGRVDDQAGLGSRRDGRRPAVDAR